MLSLKNLKTLLAIAKDLKKQLALATLFGSLGHLSVVIFTLMLTLVFLNNGWYIYLLVAGALLLAFCKGFFSYAEQLLNHYVAFKILHVLRVKVMEKLKKISLEKFFKNNSGDYMTIITTDIEILEVFYAHTITPFLIYVVQMLAISGFIALFNVKLSLLVLVLYIIIGLIVPLTSKNRGEFYGADFRQNLTEINNNSAEEVYAVFENIQYNKLTHAQEKLARETEKLTASSYRKARFQININFLTTVLYNLSILIFIFAANYFLENKNMVIALAAMYIISFTPVLYMGNLASTLSQTMAAGSRFIDLMATEEVARKRGQEVDFQELVVENLNFNYEEKEIIKNLSFTAKRGEIVGICGESGSGKSTVAKIIMKLLPANAGAIKIDSVALEDIDNSLFREQSAIIMQDTYLFNTTLAKNVSIFEKKLNEKRLWQSLDNTNLQNFVTSLEKKEQTIIGERSANISSGQKQRLSTARALYSDAKLLILDEAAANIDIFSEIELLKTLEHIKKDKIILLISHNKSTLSICDKLVEVG